VARARAASRLRHCAGWRTRQLLLVALCVEALEGAPVHHGFAAHFEGGHAESTRSGRERMVRAFSVTSRPPSRRRGSPPGGSALLVFDGHRKAIQLQLRHVRVPGTLQQLAHAAVEIRSSPSFSALSRLSMGALWRTLTKPSRGLRQPARPANREKPAPDGPLQFPQAAHQGVVLGVADFRLVQDVVQMLVAAQLGAAFRLPARSLSLCSHL